MQKGMVVEPIPFDRNVPIIGELSPSVVKIGIVVMLRGILDKKVYPALIYRIHPSPKMMTDPMGEEREWNGRFPIIDAVVVMPAKDQNGEMTRNDAGEFVMVQNLPWDGDITGGVAWQRLPAFMKQQSPRYVVIGEMHGQ